MNVLFTNLGLHGPYTGQMEAVLHQMSPFEGRSHIDRNPVAGSLPQLAQHLAAVGPGLLAMIAGDEVHASGLERKIGLGQQPIYPSAADRKPVPLPSPRITNNQLPPVIQQASATLKKKVAYASKRHIAGHRSPFVRGSQIFAPADSSSGVASFYSKKREQFTRGFAVIRVISICLLAGITAQPIAALWQTWKNGFEPEQSIPGGPHGRTA